ncbi:MAG TPA: hypothetical protein VN648_30430, partial [Candidatus Methylomirabilis sp.]|nr:hypothetical protein [Candidatus Methylomirabilis sp.]
ELVEALRVKRSALASRFRIQEQAFDVAGTDGFPVTTVQAWGIRRGVPRWLRRLWPLPRAL